MFKNNVFKPDVNTIKWLKAAGVRAAKTMAQTFIAMTVGAVALNDVNWGYVGSAAALAGVISIVTSIAGIPEVESEGDAQ